MQFSLSLSRAYTAVGTFEARLVHSADEYNLHGAKRLFIPNVLSASCPSVKQDGENKWFLHTDCFT